MAWYLNRALTGFRDAVNAAYPRRDKTTDGTIADEAHQGTGSDHEEDPDGSVDAWDMDVDLRSGDDAAAIERLKRVFEAHPSSKYWIHNDQIAFRSEGWRPRSYAYAGANRNRHYKHVHWNTRESHEDSTAPWILEDDMPTPAEYAKAVWDTEVINAATGKPVSMRAIMAWMDKVHAGQADRTILALAEVVARESANPDEVRAAVDVDAVVSGVLAGLPPERIAAAIPTELAEQVVDALAARISSPQS